jgi:high-affinity iron transporter
MLSAFIITFREAVEAALIISLILGMMKTIRGESQVMIVWRGTITAVLTTLLILLGISVFGYRLENLLTGRNEILYEGVIQIGSAIFLLWTVFSLHKYFILRKGHLVASIKKTLASNEEKSLFWLVFILIFKEGLEVVLFLSSVYLTSKPQEVISGTVLALLSTLFFASIVYKTETKIPVWYAYRITSAILIIASAAFIIKGLMEISELII